MATTPAVSDVKYSMLVVAADGVTRQYEFNFAGGYISKSHIKIQFEDDASGAVTEIEAADIEWVNDNTVALGPAVTTIPVGNTVTVYRDTPKDEPLVNYTDGAIINERNLDTSFNQAIFASAEMVDRFLTVQDVSDTANTNALAALAASAEAVATADQAAADAAQSVADSSAAVATANQAAEDAGTALSVANGIDAKATTALANSVEALDTANAIDGKAQSALDASAAAVTTANAASTTANAAAATANAIDGKAQSALDASAAAVTTANSASTAAGTALTTANTAKTTADNTVTALATFQTDVSAHYVYKDAATGGAFITSGTTAQRPAVTAGQHPIRYNSDLLQFEGYGNGAWGTIGGGATGGGTNKAFYLNDQIITTNYSIPANTNAGSFGEITIADGVEVEVGAGAEWTVV